MSPSQATESLKELTRTLITPWTISLYRQAAIAIAKRHIRDLVKKRNCYHPDEGSDPIRVLAAGVGHRPRMLLTGYAIDIALLSRLQPELLEMYSQLSGLWQHWNKEYYYRHCVAKESAPAQVPPCNPVGASTPNLGYRSKGMGPASRHDVSREIKVHAMNDDPRDTQSCPGDKAPQAPQGFIHNREHQILIYVTCKSAISPGRRALYRHLNRKHRILGPACRSYVERLGSLELLPPLKDVTTPRDKIIAIPGLRVFRLFRCNICRYLTTRWATILDHISSHKVGIRPSVAWGDNHISACYGQTLSAAKGRIVYFEVTLIGDGNRCDNAELHRGG